MRSPSTRMSSWPASTLQPELGDLAVDGHPPLRRSAPRWHAAAGHTGRRHDLLQAFASIVGHLGLLRRRRRRSRRSSSSSSSSSSADATASRSWAIASRATRSSAPVSSSISSSCARRRAPRRVAARPARASSLAGRRRPRPGRPARPRGPTDAAPVDAQLATLLQAPAGGLELVGRRFVGGGVLDQEVGQRGQVVEPGQADLLEELGRGAVQHRLPRSVVAARPPR